MTNKIPEAEYIANLPTKRMAAGVIILNVEDKILIVKPTYKDHWSVPGGVIEKDESPRSAAVREAKEEIGLDLKQMDFLGVDYMSPQDSGYSTKNENLQFVFFGGKLTHQEIMQIKLPADELNDFKFVEIDEALKLVNSRLAKRLAVCFNQITNGKAVYLEGGKITKGT